MKTIEDVFLDKLISVVDENIEKTEDYKKRISETYHIMAVSYTHLRISKFIRKQNYKPR